MTNFLATILLLLLSTDVILSIVVTEIPETDPVLDPSLKEAKSQLITIPVRKDGSGQFDTISDALGSIPEQNTKRTIIWIWAGTYKEKSMIDRKKPFVMFYGSPEAMPKLTFDGTTKQYGTYDSASVFISYII